MSRPCLNSFGASRLYCRRPDSLLFGGIAIAALMAGENWSSVVSLYSYRSLDAWHLWLDGGHRPGLRIFRASR